MAATGMGGGGAWCNPIAVQREALMLESVMLAAEHGIDLNAANTDGRTALDAARALPRAGREPSPREGGQARECRQVQLTPYPVASACNRLRASIRRGRP